MGIRRLHRRPAPVAPLPPVPVVAADASTARLAPGPAEALRHRVTALRRRCAPRRAPVTALPGTDPPVWRLWGDLTRGYMAMFLTLLPRTRRSHRPRTLTVFTAPALTAPPRPPHPR
ncbi:hypothetical protein AB0O01_14910 [Streptomyces sp. NPDC093252]|uniref:hypothetical protein n=1 Tax=Streptomyces sp. NPDC093252 TaxID=3154980 RepID=UPI0034441561